MANLTKRNDDFFSVLDDFLNRDVFDWTGSRAKVGATVPAVNIQETEKGFNFDLAAPGLEKEDLNVSIDKGVLTIAAEKEVEAEESTEKYTRKEFSYSSFKRSFRLPEKDVNSEQIEAKYENGILNVFVPKREEVLSEGMKTTQIN